jgi:hypothetical protein
MYGFIEKKFSKSPPGLSSISFSPSPGSPHLATSLYSESTSLLLIHKRDSCYVCIAYVYHFQRSMCDKQ